MSAEPAEYKLIDRKIGLIGGSVLLMGSVIGISVFFLPGRLIGEAGPSILVALAITAPPMFFSVLSLLQLGGAMPVAGGLYVYGSRLVSPFWGFISIWLLLPAIWSTLLFTSIGFAEFTRFFVDVPAGVLAVGVLLVFIALNLRGVTLVAWVQLVMVAAIIVAIVAFVVPGLTQVEAANYAPLFPRGVTPALIAVVSLYIPFQGFSMIVELGEELDDPIRNIPRVLMLGMGIAVLLSLALVAVFVGLDRWDALGDLGDGGIAQAAADYLPGWVAVAVAMGAVLGAFTTLNAVITSYSRTLMRASRDGVVSPRLAELGARTQVPYWSVLVLSLPPVLAAAFTPDVVTLTVFLALVILFGNFVGSIALWNLPKRFPAAYEHSIYRLPMWLLRTAAIGSAGFALLFWLAIVASAPMIVVVLLGIILLGAVAYLVRVRQLRGRGVDLRARLKQLHAHEAAIAGTAAASVRDHDGGPDPSSTATVPPRQRFRVPPPPSRRAEPAQVGARPELTQVPGLGPARREALVEHFGSTEDVARASRQELREVPGIGDKLAATIEETMRASR